MTQAITFWSVLVLVPILILLALSLPPAIRSRSWKRFFMALLISFAGIVFPLFVFLTSALLVPGWKGECRFGWVNCFHVGKLVLTPLVLWANVALYVIQIHRPDGYPRTWVILGLFTGAVVSVVCLVFGIAIHSFVSVLQWWLAVPLYVAIWYSVLCVRVCRAYPLSGHSYRAALLGSLPLWGLGLAASRMHYLSLPDHPPSCFVVTATLRGHEGLIGSLCEIRRDGVVRVASRQLLVFWQLEEVWSNRHPRSHRVFRKFYNRIGPKVAGLIRSRFTADVLYLLLRPLELLSVVVLRFLALKGTQSSRRIV
jgi:hypothetical protein